MNSDKIQLTIMLLLAACIILCLLFITQSENVLLTELGKGLLVVFSLAALKITHNNKSLSKK